MECVIGGFRGYDGNLKWQQTLMNYTLKVITHFDWSTLWNISRTMESIPKWCLLGVISWEITLIFIGKLLGTFEVS